MFEPKFPFQFVGNDLAIDFVNTRILVRDELVDLIETPEALSAWLEAAGVTAAGRWTKEWLASAGALRQAIRDALTSKAAGKAAPGEAIKVINDHLAQSARQMRLSAAADGYALAPAQEHLSPEAVLGLLAQRAAELLVAADPRSLKNCANESCVLIFKDVSRGNKRRWCSMETCGNRSKAAAHYRSSKA
ncbi:CGNR zinc finger domain-containing protein [Denitrobaculum tricleocarpae]|uniref:Zinc finger CGNR domain-containing protein n=1 Tax=Denitrobaculum tricleocarpae TaxID=2591009 RepID=A0A545TL48_9PROT|nr:ABATE domain-containing protein [Denitrobaculum tricleocarpae]TQV77928.1 hypothetical protein FKG95_20540 [Denitrobaculum tricleocarpae]